MVYEWDQAKRARNLAKHGVDFNEVQAFEWDSSIQLQDVRRDYGEPRWQALGFIGDRLHMLVFTERNTRIRIISLRRANSREFDRYETYRHPADSGGR